MKPLTNNLAPLVGREISNVYAHEGSPGGHNNDRVVLEFVDGGRLEINAYNPGYMRIEVDGDA